jgi:hypothetical protein
MKGIFWNDEDTKFLVENFANMSVKELAIKLGMTEGAIRGKKGRMGLRAKFKPFTQEEKNIIIEWYIKHPYRLDLDKLSELLQRQKTSICRLARQIGITDIYRTFEKKSNNPDITKVSMRGKDEGARRGQEKLIWKSRNDHYRGMLGKHHTEETRNKMSKSHKEVWENFPDEKKQFVIENMIHAREENYKNYPLSIRLYSKGNVGYRDDLQHYFRSNWESNIARYLNYIGLNWQYEPKRFFFENVSEKPNSYLPDFYLPTLDTWIEVKGWMDEKSKLKLELFKQQYPDEFSKFILIDQQSYMSIQKEFGYLIENWEFKNKDKNKNTIEENIDNA